MRKSQELTPQQLKELINKVGQKELSAKAAHNVNETAEAGILFTRLRTSEPCKWTTRRLITRAKKLLSE